MKDGKRLLTFDKSMQVHLNEAAVSFYPTLLLIHSGLNGQSNATLILDEISTQEHGGICFLQ